MWRVEKSDSGQVHIIPTHDTPHPLDVDCWCAPESEVVVEEAPAMIIHRDELDRLELEV